MDKASVARAPDYDREKAKLAKLEDRYANELMGEDERQELRDRILKLRRRLSPVAEAYEVLGVPPVPEVRG